MHTPASHNYSQTHTHATAVACVCACVCERLGSAQKYATLSVLRVNKKAWQTPQLLHLRTLILICMWACVCVCVDCISMAINYRREYGIDMPDKFLSIHVIKDLLSSIFMAFYSSYYM